MNLIFLLLFTAPVFSARISLNTSFASASKRLSVNLLSKILDNRVIKNEIVSGLALMPSLVTLCTGSAGETHLELHNVIGLPKDSLLVKEEIEHLKNIRGISIKIANSVFITDNLELNKTHTNQIKSRIGAETQLVDFYGHINTVNDINEWFLTNTDGLVTNILSPRDFDIDTSAIAISAIYFKGQWKEPFDKSKSTIVNFLVSKYKSIPIDAIRNVGIYKFMESKSKRAKIVILPYAANNSELVIVLPNAKNGVLEIGAKKLESFFSLSPSDFEERVVKLTLPKMKIETKKYLRNDFEDLNVTQLFNHTGANLNKLIGNNTDTYGWDKDGDGVDSEKEILHVDQVIQKAYFEVSEDDSDDDSNDDDDVTTTTDKSTKYPKMRNLPVSEFKADHPFIFYVKVENNVILSGIFTGRDIKHQ